MKLFSDFYICSGCHKVFNNNTQLYILLEDSHKAFCCENCTVDFYKDLINHLKNAEKKLRGEHHLMEEDCQSLVNDQDLLSEALNAPDESYFFDNGFLGPVYIQFLWKDHPNLGSLGIVLYCIKENSKPLFILHSVISKEEKLLDALLPDEDLDEGESEEDADPENEDGKFGPSDVMVDQETLNNIESKKSQLIATLLELRSPMDIPFEKFSEYDDFLPQTLERPDEVFSEKDMEGDEHFKFFRVFNVEGKNFYYVVVGMIISVDEENMSETIVPIISFPTIDAELYRAFRKGQQVGGPLRS